MSDYISREAVLKAIWKTSAEYDVFFPTIMLDAIKAIPAADVRPVVRGKWEELPPACNGAILTRCSACKRILTDSELGMVKTFCSHCGADMRMTDNDVGSKKW